MSEPAFDLNQPPSESEKRELSPGLKALSEYQVNPKESELLKGDREYAEQYAPPWNKTRRMYGALPHYDQKDEIIESFASEAEYFAKHYETGKGPEWRDPSYAEGALLFQMKFGENLSDFTESILAQYPPIGGVGKEISLFGLSGSGKSSAIEALKHKLGENVIVMDSDTVRYNLLAKKIKDVEQASGAGMDEIRNDLINNAISGPLYFALNHITKELKSRGYSIIQSSTQPNPGADLSFYLQHPDGIDPRKVSEENRDEVAKDLYERTQSRVGDFDNYDWDNAETILDFNRMIDVTVRVPERAHAAFLKNISETLEKPESKITELENPNIADAGERKRHFEKLFENIELK